MSDRFEAHRRLSRQTARVYKNRGVVIQLAASYEELEEKSLAAVEPLWAKYPKTQRLWETVVGDPEAQTNWDMANYMAVNKLGFNDHGMTHALITSTNAIRIFDLLVEAGIQPDVVLSGAGDLDDAFPGDPFDRLLYATGRDLRVPIVSKDERLRTYAAQSRDVQFVW